MTRLLEVPRRLKGVSAADTAISDIRSEEGFYHYRQYNAIELSRQRTFEEEVWCLLLEVRTPTQG